MPNGQHPGELPAMEANLIAQAPPTWQIQIAPINFRLIISMLLENGITYRYAHHLRVKHGEVIEEHIISFVGWHANVVGNGRNPEEAFINAFKEMAIRDLGTAPSEEDFDE